MDFFWIIAVILVMVLGLVLHRRDKFYSWCWNFLVIITVLYLGFYHLTGTPRSTCMLSTLNWMTGDREILHHTMIANQGIYLLISDDRRPLYVQLPWSNETAKSLMKAEMVATKDGAPLMVRTEALSRCVWDEKEEAKQGKTGSRPGQNDGRQADQEGRERSPRDGIDYEDSQIFYPAPVRSDPLKQAPVIRIERRNGMESLQSPPPQ